MNEFEVYLVSNGSMQLYTENTLSAFTNMLAEPLSLDGDWRVAISELSTPAFIKNILPCNFSSVGPNFKGGVQWGWSPINVHQLPAGIYHSGAELIDEIARISSLNIGSELNPINHKLSITFDRGYGLSFGTNEIPNLLGFEAFKTAGQFSIGHSQYWDRYGKEDALANPTFKLVGDYPVDLTSGRHLIFVYTNIIEYQSVGDTKAPLLRLVPVNSRIRKGELFDFETQKSKTFNELQFKELLSNTIQSIKIELRDEIGNLVPFLGSGRTAITLKFKKSS